MIGILSTLVFAYLATLAGRLLVERALEGRHPAAVLGISGLLGLGGCGLVTLFLGLLPNGIVIAGIGLGAMLATAFTLMAFQRRLWLAPLGRRPQGLEWLAVAVLGFTLLAGVIGTTAPSIMSDWDTIAYHLAVPKIWLTDGQIHPISFIHHSNFPASIDLLFLWGLKYGGQAGAKAFTLVITLLGAFAVFGLARERYGPAAGSWAVAAFASIPVVVWETGTGYIDVAHGLYAGLGAWLLFLGMESNRKGAVLVGGILLGFAAGTKYTGLQALIAVGLVASAVLFVRRTPGLGKSVGLAALTALVVAAPWYVRNAAWTGNPVYPFFFERFGGMHWTQLQADVYRNEQKTFGVPLDSPLAAPHAILGLAYQPGRYINPGQKLEIVDGQPRGGLGNPLGAIGAPIMAALVFGSLYWRKLGGTVGRPLIEPAVLGWIVLGLLMWVALSQQGRYILSFAPPLAILVGGLVTKVTLGRVLAGLVVAQSLWTGFLAKEALLSPDRIRVAFGAEAPAAYLKRNLPVYDAAEFLNSRGAKRVGLFDEVFGFYFDVPYFWAGFGHSDEMGYESMQTVDDFMAAIERLGFDHLYVSLVFADREFAMRWLGAMGLGDSPGPLPDEERTALMADPQSRWKPLLADAVREGRLHVLSIQGRGLIIRVGQQ